MKPRIIFVNGRFLTQPVTGVQRYAFELMRNIDKLLVEDIYSPKLKIICLAPSINFAIPNWEKIEIRRIGFGEQNIWEQLFLPLYVKSQLLFSPTNTGPWHYTNQVITFHDASVFAVPHAYSSTFRTKYTFILRQLSKRASLILTDSKFSQRELAQYLRIDNTRFSVIHLGSDHLDNIQSDPQILHRHNLERNKYLLLVGNHSLHKNFERIVQATSLLKIDIKYVVVGGSFKKVFKENICNPLPSNIQNLGFVNDQELKTLYQNALGLIFPSTYEGFGLPVLEAMRSGCPVLCANCASLPEVAGDAALYFDPFNVENIASVIDCFFANPQLQDQLRKKGYQRSERFKWSSTAINTVENILSVYTKVAVSK